MTGQGPGGRVPVSPRMDRVPEPGLPYLLPRPSWRVDRRVKASAGALLVDTLPTPAPTGTTSAPDSWSPTTPPAALLDPQPPTQPAPQPPSPSPAPPTRAPAPLRRPLRPSRTRVQKDADRLARTLPPKRSMVHLIPLAGSRPCVRARPILPRPQLRAREVPDQTGGEVGTAKEPSAWGAPRPATTGRAPVVERSKGRETRRRKQVHGQRGTRFKVLLVYDPSATSRRPRGDSAPPSPRPGPRPAPHGLPSLRGRTLGRNRRHESRAGPRGTPWRRGACACPTTDPRPAGAPVDAPVDAPTDPSRAAATTPRTTSSRATSAP